LPVRPRFASSWVAVVLAASVLAACSSSGPAKPHGTPTAPATPRTSTTPSGLPKTEFVSKANALCQVEVAKNDAVHGPRSLRDYRRIVAVVRSYETRFPRWLAKEKALAAQTSDKDELTAKWLALVASDYSRQKPFLDQMIAAAKARRADKTPKIARKISSSPNHTDMVVPFLKRYGLSDCAKLESG
jgi:hypothetical protein